MPDEIRITISKKPNDEVVWTSRYVQYGITRLAHDEITVTQFFAEQTNVSFIPGRNDYKVLMASPAGKIEIILRSIYRIGHAAKFEVYSKMLALTQKLVYPHIVRRHLNDIFVEGKTVEIEPLLINRLGVGSTRDASKCMRWEDYYGTSMFNGFTRIHVKHPRKPGKNVIFENVFMSTPNAGCVVPIIEYGQGLALRERI